MKTVPDHSTLHKAARSRRAGIALPTFGCHAQRDGALDDGALISAIKVYVPNAALNVIDRAIQMHGGTGVSKWTPLASMWTNMRTLRLADGPDEVHRMVVAREELRKYM